MGDEISLSKLGADDCSLPGSQQTLRVDIYEMSDAELARALTKLLAIPLESVRLSDYERAFCDGAGRAWARYGGLTWKQRKVARRILIAKLARLIREGLVAQWRTEDAEP